MAITVMYFLIALGADALIRTIDMNNVTVGRFGNSVILTAGPETFVFNKTNIGYSVVYNGGGTVEFKRSWQEVQQHCIHADARHRQAEEDNYLHDAESEAEYEEACQRLRGCRMAFDLVTGQSNANYWYAPEKSPT